jgi:hypothetical protein
VLSLEETLRFGAGYLQFSGSSCAARIVRARRCKRGNGHQLSPETAFVIPMTEKVVCVMTEINFCMSTPGAFET